MLKNKNKGITLVALVITIIILLILAGISISALTNTGIFQKAKDAKQKSADAELDQNTKLDEYENEIDNYLPKQNSNKTVEQAKEKVLSTEKNIELVDAKENKIVIPAGFKIIGDATTVDKGIVIEDATVDKEGNPTATAGSQFVWVPVGKITKADGTETTITLGRYEFDKTTGVESAYSGSNVEEDTNDPSTLKNIEGKSIAKNITNFKNSVKANGGYYIGRYEARTTTARNDKGNALTQITEKGTDQVYNYVTQQQAAQQAQGMYTSNNFTSDLMNSYAWDTAITFIQKCTDKTNYAKQTSLNTSFSSTGTTNDNPCNIFDMASNVIEWTTETCSYPGYPCAFRGGLFKDSDYHTGDRVSYSISDSNRYVAFRPLLYL
ncbi:unknown [Clostridium sp. CAG:470]|nr:unknown [Clostridium sp. CAG:470]